MKQVRGAFCSLISWGEGVSGRPRAGYNTSSSPRTTLLHILCDVNTKQYNCILNILGRISNRSTFYMLFMFRCFCSDVHYPWRDDNTYCSSFSLDCIVWIIRKRILFLPIEFRYNVLHCTYRSRQISAILIICFALSFKGYATSWGELQIDSLPDQRNRSPLTN